MFIDYKGTVYNTSKWTSFKYHLHSNSITYIEEGLQLITINYTYHITSPFAIEPSEYKTDKLEQIEKYILFDTENHLIGFCKRLNVN